MHPTATSASSTPAGDFASQFFQNIFAKITAWFAQAGNGIGGRAAGDLDGRTHHLIQGLGPIGIDQGHGALDHPLFDQKVFIGIGQYIDDGVADTDDVEKPFGHG